MGQLEQFWGNSGTRIALLAKFVILFEFLGKKCGGNSSMENGFYGGNSSMRGNSRFFSRFQHGNDRHQKRYFATFFASLPLIDATLYGSEISKKAIFTRITPPWGN